MPTAPTVHFSLLFLHRACSVELVGSAVALDFGCDGDPGKSLCMTTLFLQDRVAYLYYNPKEDKKKMCMPRTMSVF